MCRICKTKPVYEFTNKRKLCRRCFINWFQKKFLYTIRKFGMVKRGEGIRLEKGCDFRHAVLNDVMEILEEKGVIEINQRGRKIAIPTTVDSSADIIVNRLLKGRVKNLKEISPVNKKVIKPLYLFTDEEVLLYAKLKKLKYRKIKSKKDKISLFVDKLEKNHPEVKRAVVKGFLEMKKVL